MCIRRACALRPLWPRVELTNEHPASMQSPFPSRVLETKKHTQAAYVPVCMLIDQNIHGTHTVFSSPTPLAVHVLALTARGQKGCQASAALGHTPTKQSMKHTPPDQPTTSDCMQIHRLLKATAPPAWTPESVQPTFCMKGADKNRNSRSCAAGPAAGHAMGAATHRRWKWSRLVADGNAGAHCPMHAPGPGTTGSPHSTA